MKNILTTRGTKKIKLVILSGIIGYYSDLSYHCISVTDALENGTGISMNGVDDGVVYVV